MDKHTEHCIRLFSSLAESYDAQYAEATKKYEETDRWAHLVAAGRMSGYADAYRMAVRILSDPEWCGKRD